MFSPDTIGFRALKSYLFYGNKGNGKSMFTAYLIDLLHDQYRFTEKKYPDLPKRTVWSNQKFSLEVEEKMGEQLKYWTSAKQLSLIRNSDIIWDEVGKDIPATGFKDTPKELKQVFSHLRKRGNRLFANTQVYNDIDISFRRQVDRTFKLTKVMGSHDISATLPPVKKVWGWILIYEMDKKALENKENIDAQKEGILLIQIPKILSIKQKWVDMYDTTAELPAYKPDELEHREYKCHKCGKVHVEHEKA